MFFGDEVEVCFGERWGSKGRGGNGVVGEGEVKVG